MKKLKKIFLIRKLFNSGKYPKKYHFIETMGNIEDAVEYKPNRLEWAS